MENPEEELVVVFTTEDQVQESLIVGELNHAGIENVVRSYEDSAYDGIYETKYGHSQILVLEHDEEAAKEILQNMDFSSQS